MESGFSLKALGTYMIALGSMAIEEIVKHPIGTIISIIGLLYAFDRWRTQRIILKLKKRELNETSTDNSARRSEKRKKRQKD